MADSPENTNKVLVIKPEIPQLCSSDCGKQTEAVLRENSLVRSVLFDDGSLYMGFGQDFLHDELCLPNLLNLMIVLRGFKPGTSQNGLMKLGKLKIPTLTNLRIDSTLLRVEDYRRIYFELFQFLSNYAKSIKRLVIRHSLKPYSNIGLESISPFLNENQEDLAGIKLQLQELALDELTIYLDRFEGSHEFNLGFQILSQQTVLTRLQVQVSDGNEALCYKTIQLAVENNRDTLGHLSIIRSLITSSIDDIADILSSLRTCSNIESLKLFVFTIPTFPHPLPMNLRYLDLMGNLHPDLLVEIKNNAPMLEELHFQNLNSDCSHLYSEIMVSLRSLVKMSHLRMIKWHFPKINLDFLQERPGVIVKTSPTNAFASMIYCHVI